MVKGAMTRMDVHSTGVVPAEVVLSGIEATIPSLNLTDIFLWLFSIHTMRAINAMAMMASSEKYSRGLCSWDIIFISEKFEKILQVPSPSHSPTQKRTEMLQKGPLFLTLFFPNNPLPSIF